MYQPNETADEKKKDKRHRTGSGAVNETKRRNKEMVNRSYDPAPRCLFFFSVFHESLSSYFLGLIFFQLFFLHSIERER
tara:strand:+ start:16 stop:252 length:237 start_codon:yes stop_codon:yes gene_type:complete